MRKVEIFKATVSNWTTAGASPSELSSRYFQQAAKQVLTPQQIEKEINHWAECGGYEIVDIKVTAVEIQQHNNGGTNTVELWYTILYEQGVRNDK